MNTPTKLLTRISQLPLPVLWLGLVLALGLLFVNPVHASRIKEVASIEGVRSNQLSGFGLVIGLDGTGDQTTQMPYATQGLANYLKQLGLTLAPAQLAQLQMKNVADRKSTRLNSSHITPSRMPSSA